MTNFHDFDVQLYRDSLSRPWGFRLQGGADFNFPLTVQRVFSGSPSEGRLLRGDVILALDSYDVGRLSHRQAQDVVRVAGAGLIMRIRRQGHSGSYHAAPVSPQTRRPHSTTPRGDPASFFASNPTPKPTWQPSGGAPPRMGEFGVQYGPRSPQHQQQRIVSAAAAPSFSPAPEESALQQVEDSLQKLTMNHLNNNEDDEVDYSFTKKSVSERRKLFLQEPSHQDVPRPRSTSCTPLFRANSYSGTPYGMTSYTDTPRPTPSSGLMSASFTEGSRGRTNWGRSQNFGWSPSPEKLAAARSRPVSSVSQMQHSVMRSRESSRESSPDTGEWRGFRGGGAPLMRSTSVSILQDSPVRATTHRHVESSYPTSQRVLLSRGPFHEIGRWSMMTKYQQAPVTPTWNTNPWSVSSAPTKKYSTSATIQVGQSGKPGVRTVRRFSTPSTPMDGTMSLDRRSPRHQEPLKISIGSSWNADYHPAYPADVIPSQYHQPVSEKPWARPTARPMHRSVSQKAPRRTANRTEPGTYRPLQQSYSAVNRSQSATDPDYMSSDF